MDVQLLPVSLPADPLLMSQATFLLVAVMFFVLVVVPLAMGLVRLIVDTLRDFRLISRETYNSLSWW